MALGAAIATATSAVAFQLLAIRSSMVGIVETIKRGVGVVLAIAFGRAYFAEPITMRKVVAGLLMIAGTSILV